MNQTLANQAETPAKVYAAKSDVDSINSAIAYLQLAKAATSSERYSHNLRQAIMLAQNLWKAENL